MASTCPMFAFSEAKPEFTKFLVVIPQTKPETYIHDTCYTPFIINITNVSLYYYFYFYGDSYSEEKYVDGTLTY